MLPRTPDDDVPTGFLTGFGDGGGRDGGQSRRDFSHQKEEGKRFGKTRVLWSFLTGDLTLKKHKVEPIFLAAGLFHFQE